MGHMPEIYFETAGKQVTDFLIELGLILFDRQEIVAPLLHNQVGNGGLATDGVDRDKTARQF